MLNPGRAASYASSRFWNLTRVQMGGALAFAVALPLTTLTLFYPNFSETTSAQYTGIGAAIAALLTVYLLRNVSLYPGISSSFFVLPAVLAAYGFVFIAFLMLRLDYSRALMLASGGAVLVWVYFVQLMIESGPALRVSVVPAGTVGSLNEVPSLELCWLSSPRLIGDCDLLVADFRADLSDEWEVFLADCALQGIPVVHVKQLMESLTGRVEIEHLSENNLGSLVPFMVYLRFRRRLDFVSALVIGALLLPLFLVIAVLIKVDSSGPVLFRQVRIGYRGEPFRVTKFRTMVVHQREASLEAAMTKENDSRITSMGRILRRTRLDELPQILNILRGEMSWIGPRPEAEPLSRWYESELPFYRYRHIVPPGISGWAQVNQGHVADLDQVIGKLQYDFFYIKNFSPWLDALIVAKTVQTIVTGFGSK